MEFIDDLHFIYITRLVKQFDFDEWVYVKLKFIACVSMHHNFQFQPKEQKSHKVCVHFMEIHIEIVWLFEIVFEMRINMCSFIERDIHMILIFFPLFNRYKYSVRCAKINVNTHKKWQTRTWYINKWKKKKKHSHLFVQCHNWIDNR